ncbi:reverse transcriptase [Tanacetum coccineum]
MKALQRVWCLTQNSHKENVSPFVELSGNWAILDSFDLRKLHRSHRPDVILLMETKNKKQILEKICRSLKFNKAYYVEPVGLAGGLALWWNSTTNLTIASGNKNLIIAEGIIEIPFSGLKYTWTNKRSGEANVRERIDRAFGNIELWELCPFHTLLHKPLIGSDHAPLIYSSHPQRSKKCSTFRFESMWTTHDECEGIILQSWPDSSIENKLVNLRQNLSCCADKLKHWSKRSFGNNKTLIRYLTCELERIQGLPNVEDTYTYNNSCYKISRLHGLAKKCFGINGLKNAQGDWVYDPLEIKSLVRDHFELIFKTSGSRDFQEVIDVLNPVVSDEMNDILQAPVTNEEIYRATKKLGALKAPGEDGFSDVLSRQITKAMEFGSLSGIKMARTCPVISHIFFAHDSIFFLKTSQAECESLVSILDAYSHASGQNVNFQKSSAFFSPNTPFGLQTDLCTFLQIKKMGSKDKYLGFPSVYGWKKRREVLIKSVIQAIPIYAMQCYLLPKGFLNKLMQSVVLDHHGFGLVCSMVVTFYCRVLDGRYEHLSAQLLKRAHSDKDASCILSTMATICWSIWKAHNSFVYESAVISPYSTVALVNA